ncbi:MAG: hypothetical protein IKD85_03770 [Firmicutes bacterium]|nr:hypothetical protein [Bacillota bacterium]
MTKNHRKAWIALLLALLVMFAFTACGAEKQPVGQSAENEVSASDETGSQSLEADMNLIMDQIAEKEMTKSYADVLPDVTLADAELFGIDLEGKNVSAYVWLDQEEYVALKDKAYNMAGSAGEAIIHFTLADNGPELQNVEWSEDGSGHDQWLQDHFPAEYLEKAQAFNPYNEADPDVPHSRLIQKAAEVLGVPVETENLLQIDLENGTYEIIKTIESGSPGTDDYKFETETLEAGNLSDLAS